MEAWNIPVSSGTPLISIDSGYTDKSKAPKNDKYEYGSTSTSHEQRQGTSKSDETEKLARSAMSKVGRFLLTKCGTKRNNGEYGIQEVRVFNLLNMR